MKQTQAMQDKLNAHMRDTLDRLIAEGDMMDGPDRVNHPPHYTSNGIECIDYMEQLLTPQEFVGYLRGCMVKYQHRMMLKGSPTENAEKAQWYNNRLIETLKRLEHESA